MVIEVALVHYRPRERLKRNNLSTRKNEVVVPWEGV